MAIVVFSAGRSGTNMVLEILARSPMLVTSKEPEDKTFFIMESGHGIEYFLTKSDTTYCRSHIYFDTVMEKFPKTKIIWTVRDPRDWCMSKIKRGYEREADDATLWGCIADMFHMFDLYTRAIKKFPDNILTVKMEDVLLNIDYEIGRICSWVGIPPEKEMREFYKYMRNDGKIKRYNSIDTSQVGLWRNFENAYDGYLMGIDVDFELLFNYVDPIVRYFGYEEDTDAANIDTINCLPM